jgi:hypothetical protein
VEVHIHNPVFHPSMGQGYGKVGRHGALSHTPLARQDQGLCLIEPGVGQGIVFGEHLELVIGRRSPAGPAAALLSPHFIASLAPPANRVDLSPLRFR